MTTLTTLFLLPLACLHCFGVLTIVQGQGETTWLMSASLTPSIGGSVATTSTAAPTSPATLATGTVRMTAIFSNTADDSMSSSTKVTDIISATSSASLAAAGASPASTTGVSSATAGITAFLSAAQSGAISTAAMSTADAATASTPTAEAASSSSLSGTPGSASSGAPILSATATQFTTASLLDANGSSSTYADGKSDITLSNFWQSSFGSSAATSRLSSDTTPVGQLLSTTLATSNTTASDSSNGTVSSTVTERTTSLWWLSLLVLSFVAVLATLIAIAAVYRRIQQQRFRLMSVNYLESAWKQNVTERLRPGPAIKTTITFENSAYEGEGESRF